QDDLLATLREAVRLDPKDGSAPLGMGNESIGLPCHYPELPGLMSAVRNASSQGMLGDDVDEIRQLDRMGLVERAQVGAESGQNGLQLRIDSLQLHAQSIRRC